jgi:dienelactone hydrolase
VPETLAPDPQPVDVLTADGQTLRGTYYPGARNPSPLVILMHWAPGDAHEWDAIALWLQNRGQSAPTPSSPVRTPWLDGSWFPEIAAGRSYAVFTFTFRECEGGCKRFLRDQWLLDAEAAMGAGQSLPGVDPARIVAVGASIGADGAVDGCAAANKATPNSCLGALSLSPGDYLTLPYSDMVAALGTEAPPKPAWCLYATGDKASAQSCSAVTGTNYRIVAYDGNAHGMSLVTRSVAPSVLGLLLEFLEVTIPS